MGDGCVAKTRAERFRLAFETYAKATSECIAELVWPTRCVLCERSGAVLCESCRRSLPYIDQWMACPACGAPYGMLECTECNCLSLHDTGFEEAPFESCVSAVLFSDATARIVRTHKDGGERRLVHDMAYAIACAIPVEWITCDTAVVPIPATREACRARGFDHGEALALDVARLLRLPSASVLQPPSAKDQRELSRAQRFANMDSAFSLVGDRDAPRFGSAILIDDVFTTGATLFAASCLLREAGVEHVRCATFARVY